MPSPAVTKADMALPQLRTLLEELRDYTPPLDLLRKLNPRHIAPAAGKDGSWWKGKGKALPEDEMSLIRVLNGQEEIAALQTPKVSVTRRDSWSELIYGRESCSPDLLVSDSRVCFPVSSKGSCRNRQILSAIALLRSNPYKA